MLKFLLFGIIITDVGVKWKWRRKLMFYLVSVFKAKKEIEM